MPLVYSSEVLKPWMNDLSDTAAGVMLAEKGVELLFQNPEFVKLFEAAKKFWDESGEYKR